MKTAVLYTGHMRTFAQCLPTQKWQVLRHYAPDLTFYVSTIKDEDSESWRLLEKHFPGCPVYVEVVPEQPHIPMPPGVPDESRWVSGGCFTHEPYAISVPPQAVLRQLWQLNETWKLYRRSGEFGHTTFLRMRPDTWMQGFVPEHACIEKEYEIRRNGGEDITHTTITDVDPDFAATPWWGRFGGINDRMAVLGEKAAEAYFTTFARLPELIAAGCPLHPESLVCASLTDAGCPPSHKLKAEFSTLRKNGECRSPEISPIDFVHACMS